MKPSKALTINKHEAQLRVYGDAGIGLYNYSNQPQLNPNKK